MHALMAQQVKNPPSMQETSSLNQEDPLEEEMATYCSVLDWVIDGQRSLASYSPKGHKELDMTERLNMQAVHHEILKYYINTIIVITILRREKTGKETKIT